MIPYQSILFVHHVGQCEPMLSSALMLTIAALGSGFNGNIEYLNESQNPWDRKSKIFRYLFGLLLLNMIPPHIDMLSRTFELVYIWPGHSNADGENFAAYVFGQEVHVEEAVLPRKRKTYCLYTLITKGQSLWCLYP